MVCDLVVYVLPLPPSIYCCLRPSVAPFVLPIFGQLGTQAEITPPRSEAGTKRRKEELAWHLPFFFPMCPCERALYIVGCWWCMAWLFFGATWPSIVLWTILDFCVRPPKQRVRAGVMLR